MPTLISVIIPTYNRSTVLQRAIDSVLAQSFTHFELIIVDDGSDDNTHELLLSLIDSQKIKYFKQNNLGVSAARNLGAKNANGDYLAFLDSDDEWLPNKLAIQNDYLSNFPDLQIVYTDEIWIRNGKKVNQKAIHKKSGGRIFLACLQQCLIAPSSVLIKKSLFDSLNGFDESFVVCEDYDLWLKISSIHDIGFISKPLIIKYGGHSDQLSTKYFAMDFWRVKSMINIVKNYNLSDHEKINIKDSIKRRSDILKAGYQKYGNEENYRIINEMLLELDKV